MNKKRFSDLELYTIRNNIPVQRVIKTLLGIPSEISGDYFRFLCPLCRSYNTAIKTKTNLARCFRCNKNFNTIDLVMVCKNLNFLQSIALLKQYQKQMKEPSEENTGNRTINKQGEGMEKINTIVTAMMNQLETNNTKQTTSSTYDNLMNHINSLERKVDYLIHKVNAMQKKRNSSHQ